MRHVTYLLVPLFFSATFGYFTGDLVDLKLNDTYCMYCFLNQCLTPLGAHAYLKMPSVPGEYELRLMDCDGNWTAMNLSVRERDFSFFVRCPEVVEQERMYLCEVYVVGDYDSYVLNDEKVVKNGKNFFRFPPPSEDGRHERTFTLCSLDKCKEQTVEFWVVGGEQTELRTYPFFFGYLVSVENRGGFNRTYSLNGVRFALGPRESKFLYLPYSGELLLYEGDVLRRRLKESPLVVLLPLCVVLFIALSRMRRPWDTFVLNLR